MSNSNRIEVRRWNPTMDGYDSVIISLGDGPGAINGRGKSDKIKEIVDEIDRLYRLESELKKFILAFDAMRIYQKATKASTPRDQEFLDDLDYLRERLSL